MEKFLCKNLGLKSREESICSKGAYFWEITIPYKRTQPPGFTGMVTHVQAVDTRPICSSHTAKEQRQGTRLEACPHTHL